MGDEGKSGLDEIGVTLWLRPRKGGALSAERASELGTTLPGKRSYLTRKELDERHGPGDEALDKIAAALQDYSLRTVWRRWRALRVHGARRNVERLVAEIFNANAAKSKATSALGIAPDGESERARVLSETVAAVFGLDEESRPARRRAAAPHPQGTAGARSIGHEAIARHYSLPPGLDGSGQTIGIIEFGGAFDVADFKAAMSAAGITPPEVTSEVVGAPQGDFSDELTIDTQVAGAFAPGARIKLYFGENSMRGWLDVLATALVDERDAPSILSMSFGQPESRLSLAEIACFEEIFIGAAFVGITVIVASGDSGPTCGSPDGSLDVFYPASSRFVLACGGTELSDHDGRINGERVWNSSGKATGGGFSARSPLPAWQRRPLSGALARYRKEYTVAQGRGTPDLAAMAAPGFAVVRSGVKTAGGGTSAVAPFVAALVARINQRLDGAPAGFFAPLLYAHGEKRRAFREIRRGELSPFEPRGGWDPSVGLGAPKGSELLQLLTG
jgi:kumamolisin